MSATHCPHGLAYAGSPCYACLRAAGKLPRVVASAVQARELSDEQRARERALQLATTGGLVGAQATRWAQEFCRSASPVTQRIMVLFLAEKRDAM